MLPTQQGSVRLFRLFGIEVFLHWSWFIVAVIGFQNRVGEYTSYIWNGLEYLSLFLIVLLHEFGHALACKQVGGKANRIVLWPLGGVAYVAPPPRPGAVLWSIAAGPLVNLLLAPGLIALYLVASSAGWNLSMPNVYHFVQAAAFINVVLFIFNMLPIYPLDGGQILRALLWFPLGRARSLMVSSIIGFAGVAALVVLALLMRSIWIGIMAAFILMNCWHGLTQAKMLVQAERLPRHSGFACPECKQPPISAPVWRCAKCLKAFDTFAAGGACPHCGAAFPDTVCPECGAAHPISSWSASSHG